MATVAVKSSASTRTGFTWAAESLTSGALSVAGHSAGSIKCPADLDGIGTTWSVEASHDGGETWGAVTAAGAAAAAMTTAVDVAVSIPDDAFNSPLIRFAAASGPVADAKFKVYLTN